MEKPRLDRTKNLLIKDLEFIKESLSCFSAYSLPRDISERMESLGLSKSTLARQANVSHTMVAKWLNGEARPHGKERCKELGLALGMDRKELDSFLMKNGYPRLYLKNPLDAACLFLFGKSPGQGTTVSAYRDFQARLGLGSYSLDPHPAVLATAELSRDFSELESTGCFAAWLEEKCQYFRAYGKNTIAKPQLILFVLLHVGEQSINDMYITGELPTAIKNLLYPLLAEREVAVRGLRAKLIVFGLYENMVEDEIEIMLEMAGLCPLAEPSAAIDQAILLALRCAHERYPNFELANAEKVLKRLKGNPMKELGDYYVDQRIRAQQIVDCHALGGYKSDDRYFVETYTDFAGSGILMYIGDMLGLLIEHGVVSADEAGEYLALMRTY
jgi:transcriptional regulator with XRE-family HTH domain